jgi:LemA protein
VVLTLALYTASALVVAGVGLYVVGAYNQVIAATREADRAFANVDVSLKQRHDEIPALVETCRGYMAHEKDVLESVTSLRLQIQGAGDVDTKVVAENALTELLSRVFVLAESYPELKANELFLNLHKRLTAIENKIADRRELFNASVTAYNTLIESFPALVFARVFGWRSRPVLSLGITG